MDSPRPKRYLNARWIDLFLVLKKFPTSAQYVAKSPKSNIELKKTFKHSLFFNTGGGIFFLETLAQV